METLAFEYDAEATATAGCGATLKNIFYYFGGSGATSRQVKLCEFVLKISFIYFSRAK